MRQELFFSYIRFEKRFSEHTITAYETDLKQFKEFLLTTYEIKTDEEVQHTHIRAWIVDLLQHKIAARSINRKLSTLKSYFQFLVKTG